MGIYIHLKIVPDSISPKIWESTYEESLQLLRSYPYPLMDLTFEDLEFAVRYIFSPQLESTRNGKTYWKVVGDLKTRESGEEFRLDKDISSYLNTSQEKAVVDDVDILMEEDDKSFRVRTLFGAKTQGYKYHNAILAVAALFESRMPLHALAGGNITKKQAQEAVKWANEVLSQKIQIPICLDAIRLLDRLEKSVPGEKLVDKFTSLFLGSQKESYQLFWERGYQNLLKEWFGKQLIGYHPSTIGSLEMTMDWLNATGDLRSLVKISCINENGPLFPPEEIAKTIADIGSSIPLSEIEKLKDWALCKHELTSVPQQFACFFLRATLICLEREFYISTEEILSIFEDLFPGKKENIRTILAQHTEKAQKDLADLEKFATSMEEQIYQYEEKEGELEEIKLKMFALTTRKAEIAFLEANPNFSSLSRDELWKLLVCALSEQDFILRKTTWERIDAIQDKDMLKALLFTAILNKDRILKFREMQREILENKESTKKITLLLEESRKSYLTREDINEALENCKNF